MIAVPHPDAVGIETVVRQALEQARATGRSAFIHLRLGPDERAKPVLKAWNKVLAEVPVNYMSSSSGSRPYGDTRTEVAEYLYEIWPNDEDWEQTPSRSEPARQPVAALA
ncbi:MAG TPA: hypothetical protein VNM16_01085 [Bacillota bacterium]|nr:hypothetical protein [Bacillota bacterium]